MTSIRDEYTGLLPRRWLWAVVGCLGPMLLGLPMMRQDGIYTMKMCDEFMGQLLLPILALLEICFVAHGYGILRFSHDICFMVKKWPRFLIKFLWKYVCPAILLDCKAALKVTEDWGPRDPDERLRYHAFLKSQGFGRVVSLSEEAAQEGGSQRESGSLEDNEGGGGGSPSGKRAGDAVASQKSQQPDPTAPPPHNPIAMPADEPSDVLLTSASPSSTTGPPVVTASSTNES